jgi:hypothetical protein
MLRAAIALSFASLMLGTAAPVLAGPLVPSTGTDSSIVTPVRDGCGRGFHWSPLLRRCVRNG